MFFDPLWIILSLPAIILSLWAQAKVTRAFKLYSRVRNFHGLTGAEAAQKILQYHGINDVRIEEIGGVLTDHYDPTTKVLRLSPKVYEEPTVTALAVAAHEAGHAIQHKVGYAMLKLRTMMVKSTIISSYFAPFLLLAGFVLASAKFLWAGIILYSISVAFTLVTLPVEFDASRRAKETLQAMGLVNHAEAEGVEKVLNAAAMTYVAAAVAAILELLYFIIRASDR